MAEHKYKCRTLKCPGSFVFILYHLREIMKGKDQHVGEEPPLLAKCIILLFSWVEGRGWKMQFLGKAPGHGEQMGKG